MQQDKCGESFQDCEEGSKSKNVTTLSLLALTSFGFIICFKIIYIFATSCWYNCQASGLMHGQCIYENQYY